MSTNPLLSVVVICRNCLADLTRTLNSVFVQQGAKEIDIVIVDAGSSDGTREFLAQQAQYHETLSWVSEPDRGISDGHRKGVLRARGEYVLFLNSGDVFDHDHVYFDFIKALETEHTAVLFGSARYFDRDRDLKWSWPFFRDITPEWLNHFHPHHQATFFRRGLFENYPVDAAFKMAGDHDLYARLMAGGITFRYVGFDVAQFDVNGTGTDGQSFRRSFRQSSERLLIIWRHIEPCQALVQFLPLMVSAFGRSLLRKLLGAERFLWLVKRNQSRRQAPYSIPGRKT